MEDETEEIYAQLITDFINDLSEWYLRGSVFRTNWLYRIDALCNHDISEMSLIWEVVQLCILCICLFNMDTCN